MGMEITLEHILERQRELNEIIDRYRNTSAKRPPIDIKASTILLGPGEHYAGVILDESGQIKHHLVLMAERPGKDLSWSEAMAWASKVGGQIPDRQEQALLYANCKQHLQAVWHWSSQTHESDASSAWYCYFIHGGQNGLRKSYEGAAVAVRRV